MMRTRSTCLRMAGLLAAVVLSATSGCGAPEELDELDETEVAEEPSALHDAATGAVYTMTNDMTHNAAAVFSRDPDGTLTPLGHFFTGGRGTGGGLGSQGAVALSPGRWWLYVVNAGSNDISTFRVRDDGLHLVGRVPSGGERPISVTVHGRLLYVLNAGGAGNITGFHVAPGGQLHPLPASTRPLSGGATQPAQVSFSPDGSALVVTEKATNRIDTYLLDRWGRAGAPMVHASAGQTPFGFAFDLQGRLFVSEAFGGMPDASALSSYRVSDAGHLQTISPSVRTTETAACWVVVTGDGRYAYATNTGSSSVSGYRISSSGMITLLDADGVTGQTAAGSRPIDAALSRGSRFLYVLSAGTNDISAFAIGRDGALSPLGHVGGLPAGASGLAAR